MSTFHRAAAVLGVLAAALALPAHAGKATVCTITVNSPDEREVFRRSLPADRYEFVELVERGRPDWLASACRRQVRCDALVISGHFAGTEFYSSRFHVEESLPVAEMERAICSESCPGLFSGLKEVYLFGCDTLKPEPVRSAMPEIVRGLVRAGQPREQAERLARSLSERHTESSRDLMRRLFAGVPVIYGFSSLAPLGKVAGPMLQRHFDLGADEAVGSGRVSPRLAKLFAPSSMVVTAGQRASEPGAAFRGEVCGYYDDRMTLASRIAFMHRQLAAPMPALRMEFERVERFFASLDAEARSAPDAARALAALSGDGAARERYLATTRETEDPALRVRMIALARSAGWLDPVGERNETAHMIRDLLASRSVGFGEVDLICTLNRERALDAALGEVATARARGAAGSGALACLGSDEDRRRVLAALASEEEAEVQAAQAYLRHRPITDAAELRQVAFGIARMKGTAAQVRALETLARHHVADAEVIGELGRLFARTASAAVQRAIAEIFLRADAGTIASTELVTVLQKHRLAPVGGGQDLVDVLIGRLQPS
ncbi:MAG TPA: hypothetical protein VFK48_15310 [Usitatibacter sp.]|nr:hypothetical protein [Usitatibacter sp.]